jgi:hypothetical protein
LSGLRRIWLIGVQDTTVCRSEGDRSSGRHSGDIFVRLASHGPVVPFGTGGSPGSFVHIPAGTVHGFRVASVEARYLILTTARHGEFYRAITRPVKSPGDAFEKVTGEMVGQACREFEIQYVGPLPA